MICMYIYIYIMFRDFKTIRYWKYYQSFDRHGSLNMVFEGFSKVFICTIQQNINKYHIF